MWNTFKSAILAGICIGIAGEYLYRIYDESRGRPLYIVAEALGFENED